MLSLRAFLSKKQVKGIKMSGWMDYFSNPKSHYLKKIMFDILQERYAKNEDIIDRLSVTLLTENDLNAFVKLITDTYELGYMKSVNDHKAELEKIGLTAKVVPSVTN
mgnify:CR=1 FL=1